MSDPRVITVTLPRWVAAAVYNLGKVPATERRFLWHAQVDSLLSGLVKAFELAEQAPEIEPVIPTTQVLILGLEP